jgi:hypothetical protein
LFLWYGLDPVLKWFRPQASNMAIGMFYFLVVGASALAAYAIGVAVGCLCSHRLLDAGQLNTQTFVKGAMWAALGLAVGTSAIPLVALEFALAAAMAALAILAVSLAAVCFYLITCAGHPQLTADCRD